MAIIAIISVGVYNSYLLLIRQTKEGEVKQTAALEGKKVIEEINLAIEDGEFNISDNNLNINYIQLEQDTSDSNTYKRYLDEHFNECSKEFAKYIETINLSKTTAKTNNSNIIYINSIGGIGTDNEDSSDIVGTFEYYVSIENKNQDIEINYMDDNDQNITNIGTNPAIIKEDKKVFVYTSFDNSNKEKKIIIKDTNGRELLGRIFKNIDDSDEEEKQIKLTINLKNYILEDSSSNIELNSYNTDTQPLNIVLQKSKDLDIDVNTRQGEVNVYNNRAEDEKNLGELYNIKAEILDLNGKELFSGYCNKNVNIEDD